MRRALHRLCLALVLLMATASAALAQESRGTITGIVKDPTGAALPGVTITATNVDTKVPSVVVTDKDGFYRIPFLPAGFYDITAELSGFTKGLRTRGEVQVAAVLQTDFSLQPGKAETIEVVGETPLLNTSSGISGMVITSKQINELPLGDGTAYMLSRLAPGILDNSDLHFARPMDNAALSGIVANGARGGNDFTIDGAPNLSNAKGVGFSPPSSAISQFKVQTNAFDASSGHTAGATVNLAIKSGTNDWHVAGAYFNRDASRTATPLLTQRAGAAKPTRTYNRYNATLDGPLVKGKTFFMVSMEHLRDVQPEPATYTVPTLKMRQGDFSEFASIIYDPRTATGSNSTRTPFANNQIPADRIDPVAAAYTKLYPEPTSPALSSNYFTNQLRPYDYDAWMARIDQNFNTNNRLFGTFYYNKRREDRYNWALGAANATGDGTINGFLVTQGYDYRTNTGYNGGYTRTISTNAVFDTRVSVTTFGEWRDPAQSFDPSTMGFSSTALGAMNGYNYLPFITFGGFSSTNSGSTIASLGSMRSDWSNGFNRPMTMISILPTYSRMWGAHSIRAGYDLRWEHWTIQNDGYPGGRYFFNGAYTRQNNGAGLNDRAQEFAQFLLGLPTVQNGTVATTATAGLGSQFEIASPGTFTQALNALFVQDDWRLSDKITVNLGMRFEINGGMSESQNRNLAGFDLTTPNPISGAALAKYATNPIPEIPVADFKVNGGPLFANGPTNNTAYKPLPRGAIAFAPSPKWVLRGGVGLFSYDYFFENINQLGYSQATPVVVTNDNGATFTGATLSNPLPSGQLTQPTGNTLGLATGLGLSLGNLYQPDRQTPYYVRSEFSAQRDLGMGFVVSGMVVLSQGHQLPVLQATNNLFYQYLSTSRFRDTANESYLSASVPNPFQGLLPNNTAFNGATIVRNQMLRPYPEFGAFSLEVYSGHDDYKAVSIQVDKHFHSGNSFVMQYTRSALYDWLNFLNPQDGILEKRRSTDDRPNRFSAGASLRLPFGVNEHWGKSWNGLTDAILGGWQVNGTYEYQTGFPISWGATYYDESCGDPAKLKSNIGKKVDGKILGLDAPAWDLSCFYFHDAAVQTNGVDDPVKQRADGRINIATANNVRYFPSTLPNMRNMAVNLLDLGVSKNFKLAGNSTLQIRFEAINALNYTVLFSPDTNPRNSTFGFVTTDRNNPRDIQIGVRFTY